MNLSKIYRLSNLGVFHIPRCTVLNTRFILGKGSELLNELFTDVSNTQKKPLKPFIRFLEEHRPAMKSQHPNLLNKDLTKLMTDMWYKLSHEERQKYITSYAEELTKYIQTKESSQNETLTNCDTKKRKREKKLERLRKRQLNKIYKKPTRPMNYFLIYSKEMKERENAVLNTREDYQKWVAKVCEQWRKLDEKDKQKYREEYQKLKSEYDYEIIKWEKNVVEAGYSFLLPKYKQIDFQPSNPHYGKKSRSELNRLANVQEKAEKK